MKSEKERINLVELFFGLLKFGNLLDRGGKLSITNIAVVILITKMAIAPVIDWTVVAGLLVTLLNYSQKRYEANKAAKAEAKTLDTIALMDEVKALKTKVETVEANYEPISKQAEEVRKIVQNHNLQDTFKSKGRY